LVCNLLVKPVADKHYMTDAELEEERRLAHEKAMMTSAGNANNAHTESHPLLATFVWVLVGIPISYGIWSTLQKAWILFH
jgi:hypothetical protein